ncbi:MAG: ATP-binding protein [Caldilinea sp. CFX5]|nr:ATP-binding protein [Caldilinea sp. CFX5]
MTPNNRSHPLFTLRTDAIVGRAEEIAKLQQVLADLTTTTDHTLFFYIAGDGGMGKTRFLEWVLNTYSPPHKTFRTPILDFYNSILRTDVDLVEHIYDAIEPALSQEKLTDYFAEYRTLRERFRRQETDAAGGQSGESVISAFVKAWTPLAVAGYRLIILLDTAELLRFEDDPVRHKFDAPQPVASTKRWLLEMVDDDSKLLGVLFVVAGRKKESPTLYAEFCERAAHGAQSSKQRVIDLEGFQPAGTDAYFAQLTKILQTRGYQDEADIIAGIDSEQRAALHQLTKGSPIALAIALQLLIDGVSSEIPTLINNQLNQSVAPTADLEPHFQAALITELANYQAFGEVGIVMRYMALARKGLTPSRLAKLLQKIGSNLPDVEFAALFTELAQQIYVKVLPDGALVLHDKVAEWVTRLFEDAEAIYLYAALYDIYEEEIAEQTRTIADLLPFADPFTEMEEIDEMSGSVAVRVIPDPAAVQSAHELRRVRRKRRNLIIEQMTYALRSDPIRGYKIYYELAEEAFNVGRMDYDMQIRTEFLQWWMDEHPVGSGQYPNRQQAAAVGLTQAIIEADFAVRAVQRTYSAESIDAITLSPSQRSQATIALVNKILQSVGDKRDDFTLPPFAETWLNLYTDLARGQLVANEEEITQVRQSFQSHIREFIVLLNNRGKTEDGNNLAVFLLTSALAFAYYELGFFESNHGNHGDAIESFNRSLPLYRRLGFEINQARSLNDKGDSLAVVGFAQRAETSVHDALLLRKQLGFSYPIGLSYNTLAIVHTMAERPASALRYAKYALSIFRSLSHDYGQMIANRACSEAYRRDAERVGVANRKVQQIRLKDALDASKAALTFAEALLTDKDALLVDIYIEHGSAWRDLARFYGQNPDLREKMAVDPIHESEAWLQAGVDLARTIPGARTQLIDAMIDLAYLRYYEALTSATDKTTRLTNAQVATERAIAEIPSTYRDLPLPDGQAKTLSVYWSLLTKAHGLLMTITRQRLYLQHPHLSINETTMADARKLLAEATLALYFSSLLEANVRNVRRANQIIYEAFQTFSFEALEWFAQQATEVAQSLQIPADQQQAMKQYLAENFGIDLIVEQ